MPRPINLADICGTGFYSLLYEDMKVFSMNAFSKSNKKKLGEQSNYFENASKPEPVEEKIQKESSERKYFTDKSLLLKC